MKSGAFWQFYASSIVSLQILHVAWICARTNVDYGLSQSSEAETQALLMFFLCIGGIIGSISQLWFVEQVGRKKSIQLLSIPLIVGCWIIILTEHIYCSYAAWLIIGVSAGAASVSIPVFCTEITSNKNRGMLNAIFIFAYASGNIIGICVAYFSADYRKQVTYSFIIPTIFALGFWFLPETPEYLKTMKMIQESEDSYQFYHGSTSSSEAEKFIVHSTSSETSFERKNLNTPSVRRALVISTIMSAMPCICGVTFLLSYSAKFLSESTEFQFLIEPDLLIALVPAVAAVFTILLIEYFGRKRLLVGSLIATAIGLIAYQLSRQQFQCADQIKSIILLLTVFLASLGLLSVPHIYKMDILPPKIRNITMIILNIIAWTFSACAVNLYSYIVLHFEGYAIGFGSACLACLIYILIFVPETKSKSFQSIERLFEH